MIRRAARALPLSVAASRNGAIFPSPRMRPVLARINPQARLLFSGFKSPAERSTDQSKTDAKAGGAPSSTETTVEKPNPVASAPADADSSNDLKKQIETLNDDHAKKVAELTDKYMRALAETENVRTRLTKQIQEARQFAIQSFCKDLLEVADVLSKATEAVPPNELSRNVHLKNLFDGLKVTEAEMQQVFHRNSLRKIDPLGEKFDPNMHEALFEAPGQGGQAPGSVIVVEKIGYCLHDRVIRPAMVGVAKRI